MSIHFEAAGTLVVPMIARPKAANAIDRPTANALADTFRRFECDHLADAVLTAQDTFGAGADLKAMPEPGCSGRIKPKGDGPASKTMVLLRMLLIAAVDGHSVAGGLKVAI